MNLTNTQSLNPILSICVPTFNRATSLENLLKNLAEIKAEHGANIEICISNNCSTDDTAQIIQQWAAALQLNVVTQPKNIGLTMNCVAVSGIASGKWIMLVGDDDGVLKDSFSTFLTHLSGANEEDWILAGVADSSGHESLLGSVQSGRYDAKKFRKLMLCTGLYRYGFIGMHAFPAALKSELAHLSLEQMQPWPHLAIFLRHIQNGAVQVFNIPVVQQAAGGSVLFWSIQDMAHIKLRKLNIISETRLSLKQHGWFYDLLLIRELYLARDVRTLLFWKALEPVDFNNRALREYVKRYALVRPLYVIFLIFHAMLLLATYLMPTFLMRAMLTVVGQKGAMALYKSKKQALSGFDGVRRGI